MCHYVTAVLPRTADLLSLVEIAGRHSRNLEPLRNPSIEDRLKPGERHYLTTHGHCDCGTPLGTLDRDEAIRDRRRKATDARERRLRREGWSEAKIDRWRKEKEQHPSKSMQQGSVDDWLALLREMLGSGATPFIGLLLHWYDGPLDGRIEVRGREVVRLADLDEDALGRMKEDILYEFRARD